MGNKNIDKNALNPLCGILFQKGSNKTSHHGPLDCFCAFYIDEDYERCIFLHNAKIGKFIS
jgi:hypothetical protein